MLELICQTQGTETEELPVFGKSHLSLSFLPTLYKQ